MILLKISPDFPVPISLLRHGAWGASRDDEKVLKAPLRFPTLHDCHGEVEVRRTFWTLVNVIEKLFLHNH